MDSDLQLLTRWRGGDKTAGSELFERYFRAVHRFITNKVGDDVDDLVQQAFLACLEGRDRVRVGSTFRAYLFAAARYLVYERWRSKANASLDFEESVARDFGPTPSSVLARRADARLLLEALRRIPVDHQIALELFYLEDLKSREVADVLGIPHPTVRSRLRRGLDRLRQEVATIEAEPEPLTSTLTRIEDWAAGLPKDD